MKETIKLVNDENLPFQYCFNETSVDVGPNGEPVLRFSPVSGTVEAKAEESIEIIFTPASEKSFNFNLVCNVRKKPTPLKINVKGEGYEIHEALQTELQDGSVLQLSDNPQSETTVDFGSVQINEKRCKRITIINTGKYNFDFAWKGIKRGGIVSVVPDIGTVPKGERVHCEVSYIPVAVGMLDVDINCHIVNGGVYPLNITGSCVKPMLKFAPALIDFGTQFLASPGGNGTGAHTVSLEVTNQDAKETTFELLSPESAWYDMPRGLVTLAAGESVKLTATFLPLDSITYRDMCVFEVNGLSTVEVPVTGEGSDMRIESEPRTVNFGALRIGQSTTRQVKITNKSKISTTFYMVNAGLSKLSNFGFLFPHTDEITLRPKATLVYEFKFNPKKRLAPFHDDVLIATSGSTEPPKVLFSVSGACQGTDIRLENDTLPFGAVAHKSATTRKIQMLNIGDIGAKFQWDTKRLLPAFSISPSDGYISPGMEISLEVTFRPADLAQDIRYDNIKCEIEGGDNLYLTLTGMCIAQPLHTDTIKFSSAVRSPDTKGIALTNRTLTPWRIAPIIDSETFKGQDSIDIDPGQTKTYDITFFPLETTGQGEGGRHDASIFFPMPDGSGLLYKLAGVADKPLVCETISREFACKTTYVELLNVVNWLKKPQRFRVTTEFAKPDPAVIIKGHEFIDVGPLATKAYKLNYYAYKDGPVSLRVVFRNETTQEYIYYNITYKGLPANVTASIEMTTQVRQVQSREVIISNPLATPVSFLCTSSNTDLIVPHTLTIPAL